MSFDTIARLAATIGGTSALVCLVDEDTLRVKAAVGVKGLRPTAELMELVGQVAMSAEFFSAPDADFAANGNASIRFFAGAPIVTSAQVILGAVCVVDHQPRELSTTQRQQLSMLAELTVQIIGARPITAKVMQTRVSRERTAELAALRIAHGEVSSMYERLGVATQAAGLGIWELNLLDQRLAWDSTLFALYEVEQGSASNTYSMWRDCIHPLDLSEIEEALRTAISRGGKFEAKFRAIGASGQVKWIQAAGVLQFDAAGSPVSMTGASWDATAAVLVEHALLSGNRAAEASNRAKSEFLANMSHEIRTPLSAIIGLTELVLETRLNRQQTDYLTKVQASSRALLGILNDILDFSKIEAGRLDVERAPFQLRAVLEAVANLFGAEIAKKGLSFSLHVSPQVPDQIIGDALRLTQVLNNLLSNAIKFTAHGEIQLRLTRRQASAPNVKLQFSVTDTGIGLSRDQIAGLFQAFSQADGSTSRKYGGTGLGLVISQKLVALMGGDLSVTSELGEGATFTFSILAGAASASAIARRRQEATLGPSRDLVTALPMATRFSGLRVLLAEDNDLNRKMVVAFLEKRGATVTVVSHGGEAVDAVRRQAFDVVLMDVNMPTMDGIVATRQICSLPQGHGLPVVAMTASVMPEDRERCLAAGMVDFVVKPIDPEELSSALQKWAPEVKSDLTSSMQALAKALKSWLPGRAADQEIQEALRTDSVQALLPVALPGFDIAGALNRVDGNRDLLAYLLFIFAEDQIGLLETVSQLLAAKSRSSTADFLHSLKGVTANLGAVDLAEAANRLEQEVRAGPTLITYPAFIAAVESTLLAIRRFVRPVTTFSESAGNTLGEAAAPIDRAALLKLLQSMQPYLEAGELIPGSLIQYLRFLAQNDLPGAPLKNLIRQIDNFAHKPALVSIARLIDSNADFNPNPTS